MELNQNLNLKLTQKLTLSQDLLQSLEILQLPLTDLAAKIDEELENNPILEIDETENRSSETDQDIDNIEDVFFGEQDFFADTSSADVDTGVNADTDESDTHNRFLEGAISSKVTLTEHLMDQLGVLDLTEQEYEIGQTIITNINADGFFPYRIADIFPKEQQKTAADILDRIQMFDPPGVASFDVREAILFQIESSPQKKFNRDAYILVKDYFDLMINRKDTAMARELGVNPNQLKRILTYIGQFNPYPGRLYDSEETQYITPDVYVIREDGELVVTINDNMIPPLIVNKAYERMTQNLKKHARLNDEQKYVRDKIGKAKQFIKSIQYRNVSLYKLAVAIVNEQKEFFYLGPKYLKPFTMAQAAELIGLAESTVSRLASSKYMQTEWGLKQIKYFFSNTASKADDSGKSAEYVRHLIKEIIEADKTGKISDQAIADALKNKNINISRRTVNKYRHQMDIGSSTLRNL
ncbi:MAG: RNA polymerase factor sigma-54 [Spirochaetales bacterium]|nr:RNA polymerase factor sigma-54 [Spirochaetales bacterium]MBR6201056.1 RNA polymerase factor sigma-54 [Spirochaetales bacterium]